MMAIAFILDRNCAFYKKITKRLKSMLFSFKKFLFVATYKQHGSKFKVMHGHLNVASNAVNQWTKEIAATKVWSYANKIFGN